MNVQKDIQMKIFYISYFQKSINKKKKKMILVKKISFLLFPLKKKKI